MMVLGSTLLLLSLIIFLCANGVLLIPEKSHQIQVGKKLLEAFSTPLQFQPHLKYKDFTQNWGQLLEWQRLLGVGVKAPLLELKKQLIQDLRMERKKKKLITNTLFQALSISFMTLLFTMTLIGLHLITLSVAKIIFIIVWQIIGLIILKSGTQRLQRNFFFEADHFHLALVQLLIFSNAGLPISKILNQLPWKSLNKFKKAEFCQKRESLKKRVELWKNQGLELKQWLQEQFDESLFCSQIQLEEFEQSLAILSFMILVLFFLSTFLFIVYQMVSQVV